MNDAGSNRFDVTRRIPIASINAITKGKGEDKSVELMFHLYKDYDYRFKASGLKNAIVEVIRRIILRMVHLGIKEKLLSIYEVDKANLKVWATTREDVAKKMFKRPDKKFLISHYNYKGFNLQTINTEVK